MERVREISSKANDPQPVNELFVGRRQCVFSKMFCVTGRRQQGWMKHGSYDEHIHVEARKIRH